MVQRGVCVKKIVIDGHNLIPKVPGIQLSDPDDENKLIQMVSEYCRLSRTRADLFLIGLRLALISARGLGWLAYTMSGSAQRLMMPLSATCAVRVPTRETSWWSPLIIA